MRVLSSLWWIPFWIIIVVVMGIHRSHILEYPVWKNWTLSNMVNSMCVFPVSSRLHQIQDRYHPAIDTTSSETRIILKRCTHHFEKSFCANINRIFYMGWRWVKYDILTFLFEYCDTANTGISSHGWFLFRRYCIPYTKTHRVLIRNTTVITVVIKTDFERGRLAFDLGSA